MTTSVERGGFAFGHEDDREKFRAYCSLVEQDVSLAIAGFKELANEGHTNSMLQLGWLYQEGLAGTVDLKEAVYWYRQALRGGNKAGIEYLKWLSGNSIFEPDIKRLKELRAIWSADPLRAVDGYVELAKIGSPFSRLFLAVNYHSGSPDGIIVKDAKRAEYWYCQAIELGYQLAFYNLGLLYLEEQNYFMARDALLQGVFEWHAPCMFRLGVVYQSGQLQMEHPNVARELFEKGSSLGNIWARSALAKMMIRGGGVLEVVKGVFLYFSMPYLSFQIRHDADNSERRLGAKCG